MRQQPQRRFVVDRGALGGAKPPSRKPVSSRLRLAVREIRTEQDLRHRNELEQSRKLARLMALGDLVKILAYHRLDAVRHAWVLAQPRLVDEAADQERQGAAAVRPDEPDVGAAE